MTLEALIQRVEATLNACLEPVEFRPGRFSIWLRFVRSPQPGAPPTEQVGEIQKRVDTAGSFGELIRLVAREIVLAVYGAEVQVVKEVPNLIITLLGHRYRVHVPGAPPLEEPDQIFLKVTVYRYQPSLMELLFPKKRKKTAAEEPQQLPR